ncbi:AAWKG family protein [Streptomyces mirabilis]|uniref:AAWKG family protein n=1 Tax=Streptomyces mirabilis TaxID=68239 RepID=UPI0033241395
MAVDTWENIINLMTGWTLPKRDDITGIKGDSGTPWVNVKVKKISMSLDSGKGLGPQGDGKSWKFHYYVGTNDNLHRYEADITFADLSSGQDFWVRSNYALQHLAFSPFTTIGQSGGVGGEPDPTIGVDLTSFPKVAQAFDKAGEFFKSHTAHLSDWRTQLGSEKAAWKGNAAGVFWHLVDDLHTKYQNFTEELQPPGFKPTATSPSTGFQSSTLHGDSLIGAEAALHAAYNDLYETQANFVMRYGGTGVNATHVDGSTSQGMPPAVPAAVLDEVMLEIFDWIAANNFTQVRDRVDVEGYETWDVTDLFRDTSPSWGRLSDTSFWAAAAQEAVNRWTLNVQTNLDTPARSTVATLQQGWSRVLDAAWNTRFAFTDTSGTSLTKEAAQDKLDKATGGNGGGNGNGGGTKTNPGDLKNTLNHLGNGLNDLGSNLHNGLNSFGSNLNNLGSNLNNGLNGFGSNLSNLGTNLNGGLSNLGSNLNNGLNGFGSNLSNLGTNLNGGLSNLGSNLNNAVGGGGALSSNLANGNLLNNAALAGLPTVTNSDGSTTTRNADGSLTTKFPDGSSRTVAPDGTVTTTSPSGVTTNSTLASGQTLTNPDGSTSTLGTNGSVSTHFPDGASVTSNSDGSYTVTGADGTKTTTFPNGTVESTDANGHSQITTPNGDVSTQNPDGSVTTRFPGGGTTTVQPNGDVTATSANGQVTDSHLDPGQSVLNPDGSSTAVDSKGDITTRFPDGSSTTVHPDGTVTTTSSTASGHGSTATSSNAGANGGSDTSALHNELRNLNNGSGNLVTQTGNGSLTSHLPGGTTVTNSPDGSTTTRFPDGSSTVTSPDGQFQALPSPQTAAAATAAAGGAQATAATSALGGAGLGSSMSMLEPMMMMSSMARMGGGQQGQGGRGDGERARETYDEDADGAFIQHDGFVRPAVDHSTDPSDPEAYEDEEEDGDELFGRGRPEQPYARPGARATVQNTQPPRPVGEPDVWGTEEGGLPASIGH